MQNYSKIFQGSFGIKRTGMVMKAGEPLQLVIIILLVILLFIVALKNTLA